MERFHLTLADGWTYARLYDTDLARRDALPGWLHFVNYHRPRSATAALPPVSRVTNLFGRDS